MDKWLTKKIEKLALMRLYSKTPCCINAWCVFFLSIDNCCRVGDGFIVFPVFDILNTCDSDIDILISAIALPITPK